MIHYVDCPTFDGGECSCPSLDYSEFLAAVSASQAMHPEWRAGQAAFNVLATLRPDLSEKIRATPLDPFHLDARLPDFYLFVYQNWEDS